MQSPQGRSIDAMLVDSTKLGDSMSSRSPENSIQSPQSQRELNRIKLNNLKITENNLNLSSYSTPKAKIKKQSLEHVEKGVSNILDKIAVPKADTAPKHNDDPSSIDLNSLWSKISTLLANSLDPKIFSAWFNLLTLTGISFFTPSSTNSLDHTENNAGITLKLAAPNRFTLDHIKNHYEDLIRSSVSSVLTDQNLLHSLIKIDYEVAEAKLSSNKNAIVPKLKTNKSSDSNLDLKVENSNNINQPNESNLATNYNFSNFVVGSCNQFAHAACSKVAESPGMAYNPLLIYGGVGLGKTHLANAIGNAARRRKKKVLLVSSEMFVSELIGSLKNNSMERFKSKFRTLDVLIIDDIQFIIGKERTQEEFFHTFNELYGKQKQIIITSDKLPQDLIGLEERLRTRFQSGLSVDLQAPDFETRVAILSNKAEQSDLKIPEEVLKLIAMRIDTNVRELEGALTRLQALCNLLGEAPSLQLAQKVVDTISPLRSRELTADYIKEVVAKEFNVSVHDLSGKRRTQNIALARQVAMFLCRKHTARSFPEIGALFGGRDHSTVIHAIKSITDRMPLEETLRGQIEKIVVRLEA